MTTIYSLSTAPFRAKKFGENSADGFSMDKFELYTAAISSLVQRFCHGSTTFMHCDTLGADYLERLGLSAVWNEVRVTIPDDLEGINPLMFWAAGKLFALAATPSPVLMIDTDFIAWELPEFGEGIIAAHREELTEHVYPPITHFKMKGSYNFDKTMNYSPRPLNTAFLYIPCDEFKRYYTDSAVEFKKSAESCDDFLTYMVFAEQRLLALLAEHRKAEVQTLFELEQAHQQKSYTHIWGAKQVMRDNPGELEWFCERCRDRIRRDFPQWEWIITTIEEA
ncbi:MAG: hypothetical protein FWD35_04375, partial [Oscillospiraceae bacterium]|nr:hypothetical protein [Oscillospiraceae bacterium]